MRIFRIALGIRRHQADQRIDGSGRFVRNPEGWARLSNGKSASVYECTPFIWPYNALPVEVALPGSARIVDYPEADPLPRFRPLTLPPSI
jgi:hypothetical protein